MSELHKLGCSWASDSLELLLFELFLMLLIKEKKKSLH